MDLTNLFVSELTFLSISIERKATTQMSYAQVDDVFVIFESSESFILFENKQIHEIPKRRQTPKDVLNDSVAHNHE